MIGSFSAEILKLRKRPATWVLLGVALALTQLFGYLLLLELAHQRPELPDPGPRPAVRCWPEPCPASWSPPRWAASRCSRGRWP